MKTETGRQPSPAHGISPSPRKVGTDAGRKIDLSDVWQSTYLCINLGCTYEELKAAARVVGNSEASLRNYFEDRLPRIL